MVRVPAGKTSSLFLAVAICACLFSAAASAAPEPTTKDGTAIPLLREIPDLVLSRWRASQLASGSYQRASGTEVTFGYGNSAIAYAMLAEAARTQNDAYFESAMRAFGWLTTHRIAYQGVFNRMFVAAGYNIANSRYRSRAEFKKVKSRWALMLRHFGWIGKPIGDEYRYNKNIVEAVETLELLKTHLRSKRRGAILYDRADALARVTRLLGVVVPQRSAPYTTLVGLAEGWNRVVRVIDFSDPPDNPPAYNALVSALYARAYSLLPSRRRTALMRNTARSLVRGVIARTAPDGDVAFAGRSQEEAWAPASGIYAAWNSIRTGNKPDEPVLLSYARRSVDRLLGEHVKSALPGGFILTPAQACCGPADNPPGQDNYFDIAGYSGLTAALLEWALADQPENWSSSTARIPTDNYSVYNFPVGRGRFLQHRGNRIYWMLRGQGDNADARADSGLAVFKSKREDGSWADILPPRPFSGGHHHPADPASPCLAFGKDNAKCAYLELRDGVAAGTAYEFFAQWRDTSGRVRFAGHATAQPTPTGLRLTWTSQPGQLFKVDHFLPSARCGSLGPAAPGITIAIIELSDCQIVAQNYAGGARIDLDRVRAIVRPTTGQVVVEYAAAV